MAKLAVRSKPLIQPKKPGGPLRLDLGSGARRPDPVTQWGDDWVGIDISPDCGADVVMDLRKYPWPVADEAADELYSSHFFEHLSGPERCPFMDECWRVLKADGKFTVVVPFWSSMRSVQDPFHAWPPICEHSFLYFNKGWREQNKLTHYPIKADFDFSYGYAMDPDVAMRNPDYIARATKHDINAVMDLHVTLTRRPAA